MSAIFCVLSVEVLIEFLSSSILKKKDESGSSNWEKQSRRMDSTGAFMFELQRIWARWNLFFLIKPLRMFMYHSLFLGEWGNGFKYSWTFSIINQNWSNWVYASSTVDVKGNRGLICWYISLGLDEFTTTVRITFGLFAKLNVYL